jgi:hypothetical protein
MAILHNPSGPAPKPDADVLHDTLVLMVENMTMPHEVADVALVSGAQIGCVTLPNGMHRYFQLSV